MSRSLVFCTFLLVLASVAGYRHLQFESPLIFDAEQNRGAHFAFSGVSKLGVINIDEILGKDVIVDRVEQGEQSLRVRLLGASFVHEDEDGAHLLIIECSPQQATDSFHNLEATITIGAIQGSSSGKTGSKDSKPISFAWNYDQRKNKVKESSHYFYGRKGYQARFICEDCHLIFSGTVTLTVTIVGSGRNDKRMEILESGFVGSVDGALKYDIQIADRTGTSNRGRDYEVKRDKVKLVNWPKLNAGFNNFKVGGERIYVETSYLLTQSIRWKKNTQDVQLVSKVTGFPLEFSFGATERWATKGSSKVKLLDDPQSLGFEGFTRGDLLTSEIPEIGSKVKFGSSMSKFTVDLKLELEQYLYLKMSKHKIFSWTGFGLSSSYFLEAFKRRRGSPRLQKILWANYTIDVNTYTSTNRRNSFWDQLKDLESVGHQNAGSFARSLKGVHNGKSIDWTYGDNGDPVSLKSVQTLHPAQTIGIGETTIGDTCAYNRSFPDPDCATDTSHQVVFRFTAPATGVYGFNTSGSDFDTVLDIRVDSDAALPIACNDDTDFDDKSMITYELESGTSILIVASGYGDACGALTMHVYDSEFSIHRYYVGEEAVEGIASNYETLEEAWDDVFNYQDPADGIIEFVLFPGNHFVHEKPLEMTQDQKKYHVVKVSSLYGAVDGFGSSEDTFIDCSFVDRAFIIKNSSFSMDGISLSQCRMLNSSGGGIFTENSYSFRITNCMFSDCASNGDYSTAKGGAIAFTGETESSITDCTFADNVAEAGGAIYIGPGAYVETTGSAFLRNVASTGGAVQIGEEIGGKPAAGVGAVFDSCEFRENHVETGIGYGGAICNYGTEKPMLVKYSNFTDNIAGTGGAIATWDSGLNAEDSFFQENWVFGRLNSENVCGGAIYASASGSTANTTVSLTGCEIFKNSIVGDGAGLCIENGVVAVLSEIDFALNQVLPRTQYAWGRGGAVYCDNATLRIFDSDVSGNSWNPRLREWDNYNIGWGPLNCDSNFVEDTDLPDCSACYTQYPNGSCIAVDCDDGDSFTVGFRSVLASAMKEA